MDSDSATVTITVEEGGDPGENEAPVAVADVFMTEANQALTIVAPGVLGNDFDSDDDPLTATGVTQPANGEVQLSPDGRLTYTPDDGFSGLDTFTYKANDGKVDSAPATVTIAVDEAPPVATAIAGVAPAFTYGRWGLVTAVIAPSTASGHVALVKGSVTLTSAVVSEGKATALLFPESLPPGTHDLTLHYFGDASHAASSTTVRVVVRKVDPKMKVQAPRWIERGDRAKVRVRLSAPFDVPVTGQVSFKVAGANAITRKVRNGEASVTLPKAWETGAMRVKVTYLGSALAKPTTDWVTIRVRR